MKTVRRLLYLDILASVAFVALAFLSLFYFIDFVDRLGDVGQGGRTIWYAVGISALDIPSHLYELLPIAVLIGTIYSLARMAQASEYTILRTGGLGPGRALWLLALLGLGFAVLTFLVGDYLAPAAEQASAKLKAQAHGGLRFEGQGAWLKERRQTAAGMRSYSIHLQGTSAHGSLAGVRIFEFDEANRLRSRIEAAHATVSAAGLWQLSQVRVAHWPQITAQDKGSATSTEPIRIESLASLPWPSSLTPSVVAAAVLPMRSMGTLELWRYSKHLSGQEQASLRYDLQFWKKALYPLACLVMVALALPFAYMHARAGSVSLKVFGGIMLGISFVLLNNVVGHVGLLRGWTPWAAAASPSLLYLALSMAAFSWLVRYR